MEGFRMVVYGVAADKFILELERDNAVLQRHHHVVHSAVLGAFHSAHDYIDEV